MTSKEFLDLLPDGVMNQAKAAGDKWCIVFVSAIEDGGQKSFNLDSGDALAIIEMLVKEYGIDPMILATLDRGNKPFVANFG